MIVSHNPKSCRPFVVPGGSEDRYACLPLRARGIAMIEALITIVILAFGILGLAGLQAKMQAAEMESYQRSQALILLDDMAFRVSANLKSSENAKKNTAQENYLYILDKASPYVDEGPVGTDHTTPPDCSIRPVGPPRDICEWSNALKGAAEQVGSSAAGAMIGGRGCVEVVGVAPPSFRITVVWQGLTPTAAPAFDCGKGEYGTNDALRRAVAKVVSIPLLKPE